MRAPVIVSLLCAAACSKSESKAPPATPPAPTGPTAPAPAPGTTATAPTPAPAPAPTSVVIGKPAPDFTLDDLDGKPVSLASFKGKTVVLEWWNPQCPYVVKTHTKGPLTGTAKKYTDAGIVWLAVNSGGEGKQGFEPAANTEALAAWALTHPVLRDVDGKVGKAYGATNTPNMFVIDPAGNVVYAGAPDNSPDGESASPTGGTLVNYLDAALADVAAGRPVATPVTKPYGCSVKYAS